MENGVRQMMFQHAETPAKNEFHSISALKGKLLSQKIEAAIKQKQINKQQFAHLMEVQPSIITRWLSGSHNFTIETLFGIEEKLGIQLLAIDVPVYKQLSFSMVVGSAPAQLHNSSFVDSMSGMIPSDVTVFVQSELNPCEDDLINNKNCSRNSFFLDFLKYQNK